MWSRVRRLHLSAARPPLAAALCSGGALALWLSGRSAAASASAAVDDARQVSNRRGGDRVFTADEVATRDGVAGRRAWITVGASVYDLTDYVAAHPGGDRILSAAVGAAEAFFAQWPAHCDREDRAIAAGTTTPRVSERVQQALRPYHIGTLRDARGEHDTAAVVLDAYAAEPPRKVLGHSPPPGANGLDVVTYRLQSFCFSVCLSVSLSLCVSVLHTCSPLAQLPAVSGGAEVLWRRTRISHAE